MGEILNKIIPWILPIIMIASFLVNTRQKSGDGKSKEEKPKKKDSSTKRPKEASGEPTISTNVDSTINSE